MFPQVCGAINLSFAWLQRSSWALQQPPLELTGRDKDTSPPGAGRMSPTCFFVSGDGGGAMEETLV